MHYARRAAADGRIDQSDVAAALEMRLAHIAVGGYPETARRIPDKVRAEVFARDGGRCVLCGAPATEIDHIEGSRRRRPLRNAAVSSIAWMARKSRTNGST